MGRTPQPDPQDSPNPMSEGANDNVSEAADVSAWDDEISLMSQEEEKFPSLTDLIFSVTGGIGNCLHVACSRGHLSIVEFLCTPKNKLMNAEPANITGGEHILGMRDSGDGSEEVVQAIPDDDNSDDDSECGPERFYEIEDLVLSKNKHNATGLHLASIKGSAISLCVLFVLAVFSKNFSPRMKTVEEKIFSSLPDPISSVPRRMVSLCAEHDLCLSLCADLSS